MPRLVVFHLRDDGTRGMVRCGQTLQVLGQMAFNLMLCFHHKPETERITQAACNQAQSESTGVPQRIEQRWPRAQLGQSFLRPRQVVAFFTAGVNEVLAQHGVARAHGLRGIQRLGANFSHMVHTHQGS